MARGRRLRFRHMRYAALVFLLGCPTGHEVMLDGSRDAPSTDAPRDAPMDAPRDADTPSDCPEPPDDLCCCRGDVMHPPPRCIDGVWSCGVLGEVWSGFDCVRSCGSACTSFCSTEQTCDPQHGYLPSLRDRACTEDADCTAAPNVVDCCGTREVVGFRITDLTQFRHLAEQCALFLGECDCLPGPTTADDGSTGDPDDAIVECVDGRCRTRF